MNQILIRFRSCFSRKAAFRWFVVIITAMLVRADSLGVTSFVRGLFLDACCYAPLDHFFRSNAWTLEKLRRTWDQIVRKYAPLVRVNGKVVLVGDGIKRSKEGYRMPGVKKLHNESENSSKPSIMFGHLIGVTGILIGDMRKMFCLPLSATIQDGIKEIGSWVNPRVRQKTHPVQMAEDAYQAALPFGSAIWTGDRYFPTRPFFHRLAELNKTEKAHVDVVSRFKLNATAYEELPPSYGLKKKRRGAPRKKGAAVKLADLFESQEDEFKPVQKDLYGKAPEEKYLCRDLLWGQGLYQKMRFVLVRSEDGRKSIFGSTDCFLSPEQILSIYSRRFTIESSFRSMSQTGGFSYHFWSKFTPWLNRYRKKDASDPMKKVTGKKEKKRILAAVKATEGFLMCSCISEGILQLLALKFSNSILSKGLIYLRTQSKKIVSEAMVSAFLNRTIFLSLAEHPLLTVTKIIRLLPKMPAFQAGHLAA